MEISGALLAARIGTFKAAMHLLDMVLMVGGAIITYWKRDF